MAECKTITQTVPDGCVLTLTNEEARNLSIRLGNNHLPESVDTEAMKKDLRAICAVLHNAGFRCVSGEP